MNRDRDQRELRRLMLNAVALFVGVVLGMWFTLARAGICETDPNLCVMTPTGPALVINICGAGAGEGTCTTVQGATQAGSDDPLAIGKTVGNVKVGPTSAEMARIPVDPATSLPTPPGWSGPNSPPATASQTVTTCSWFGGSAPSGSYGTGAACVQTLLDVENAKPCPAQVSVRFSLGSCSGGNCVIHRDGSCSGQGALADIGASYSSGCPTGYSVSGSNCNLTNANTVAKPNDSKCGIQRSGNTYTFDSRDNDCTGSLATSGGLSASGDTVQAGTDRQQVKVKANADGTTDITVSTVNSRGNTDTVTGRVQNSNGQVIGEARTTQIGSGSLAGTTGSAQGSDCSTCATEATLQALRNDLITGPGAKINEQSSTWQTQRDSAATKQQAALDSLDARKAAFDSAKSSGNAGSMGIEGLTQYSAPSSADSSILNTLFPAPATCAPLVFTGGSGPRSYAMTLDVCPTVNVIRPLLDWFMAAATIMYIYFCFWRRRQPAQGEG